MDIIEFIKSRRTVRKFEQKPLSEEQLKRYIDVARVAPSGGNFQPLKYVAVQSKEMAEKVFPLTKWAGYLCDYAPKMGERPPAYIVVCTDKNIKAPCPSVDLGAAVENIILAALSEGVGACWIGSVDVIRLSEMLKLQENLSASCVIALGYPKESPREVKADGDIKYYLDGETLCVPKRSIEDVIVKTV